MARTNWTNCRVFHREPEADAFEQECRANNTFSHRTNRRVMVRRATSAQAAAARPRYSFTVFYRD